MTPDVHILSTGKSPGSAYYSSSRFEHEREIFKKSWLYLCRSDEVVNPGDFRIHEAPPTGASIILVRDRAGILRAFHNACSHRSMKVVWAEKGNAPSFRCPYHAWTYDLEGDLKWIPDDACFSDVDRQASGLKAVALQEWNGLVFINLDPEPAISLLDFLGGYGEALADLPLQTYDHGVRFSLRVKANWKLCVEANNETYHFHSLHGKTLRSMCTYAENPYSRLLYYSFAGAHHSAAAPANTSWTLDEKRPIQSFAFSHGRMPGPGAPTLGAHAGLNRESHPNWLNEQFTFFPNFILVAQSDSWLTYQFWPVAADETIVTTTVYTRRPLSARQLFSLHHLAAYARDVGLEDYVALEKQQKVIESGVFRDLQFGGGSTEILLRHSAAVLQALVKGRQDEASARVAAE